MTSCPPSDRLRELLADEDLPVADDCGGMSEQKSLATVLGPLESRADIEALIEHLGECDRCQHMLAEMSKDGATDWQNYESMLAEGSIWPVVSSASDRAQQETVAVVGTGERAEGQQHDSSLGPLAETLPGSLDDRDSFETDGVRTVPPDAGSEPLTARVVPPAPAVPGRRSQGEFADYQLLGKIGAGGMGVVYLARQRSAARVVALKIIRPEQLAALSPARRQTWLDRFRSEAQAAARLEHDHVVRVYDVGENQGTPYYSMQYIAGKSLADLVRDDPIEGRRLARLMHGVALAVDHAHQNGVLHRDLKPHNILVQQAAGKRTSNSTVAMAPDDSVDDGLDEERSFVADFGLAKNLGDDAQAGSTHTGEVMGTPSYMSPEQAVDASRCTPASDVYGLGATLYDALTGRPPFRAASPVDTLRQVIDQPPVAPRELNPAIDLDLQTITLKALEKEPGKRYPSARSLADDLLRYLGGEPIEARPIGRLERATRWCRRNPAVAMLTGGVAALLLVVAIGSALASERLRHQAERESQARQEAQNYFVMSLGVIDEMVAKYGDESLERVPGMQRVRRELLERALALYAELSATQPSNPDLRKVFARTQLRIASIYDLLGEPKQARTAYIEAIRLFDTLMEEAPKDAELRELWAKCHALLGETLRKTEPPAAQFHLETALGVQEAIHRSTPGNVAACCELCTTLNNLGLLFTDSGQYPLAEKHLTSAIRYLEQTAEQASDDERQPTVLADLGRSQINLGVMYRKLPGREQDAEDAYSQALENLGAAVDLDQQHHDHQFRLAVATVDFANLYLARGKTGIAQADPIARRAIGRFAKLSDAFPGIPLYRYEHANALNTQAIVQANLEQHDEAIRTLQAAEQVLREIEGGISDFADAEARFHGLKGRIKGGQGYLQSIQGNLDQARELAKEAMECQQAAIRLQPDNPEFENNLGQHQAFLADVLQQINTPAP